MILIVLRTDLSIVSVKLAGWNVNKNHFPWRLLDGSQRERSMTNYQHIKVNPIAIALAAEIEGVDLFQPLDDKTLHE